MESLPTKSYRVIGMMSGTSLDGVDLACCLFREDEKWTYRLQAAQTYPYTPTLLDSIDVMQDPRTTFLTFKQEQLNYSQYLSNLILNFIDHFQLKNIDFISVHGHTIYHHPKDRVTVQAANLPLLAANLGVDVIGNFRELDVLRGGEGAPLAPFGDQLFKGDVFINFGGVANIGCKDKGWDINFCNLVFNLFAKILQNKDFDEDGRLGRRGCLNQQVFEEFRQNWISLGQVSLERQKCGRLLQALLLNFKETPKEDILTSYYHFLAQQIVQNIKGLAPSEGQIEVLCSGGGAKNSFLMELIEKYGHDHFQLTVGSAEIVEFKEAIIFAYLGVKFVENIRNCKRGVGGMLAKGSLKEK